MRIALALATACASVVLAVAPGAPAQANTCELPHVHHAEILGMGAHGIDCEHAQDLAVAFLVHHDFESGWSCEHQHLANHVWLWACHKHTHKHFWLIYRKTD